MAWNRSSRLGVAAAVLIVTLGTLVGIAQAAPEPGPQRPDDCNQEGRYICIAITDEENVTHSRVGGPTRYTRYSATVRNDGASALTNGSATLTLKDVDELNAVKTERAGTTGRVVAVPTVPAGCTADPAGSTTSFTCPLPNLAAGTAAEAITFFAATSTDETTEFLRLVVKATFKESDSDNDNPGNASQTDAFTAHEDTTLETGDDFSQSVVFDGGSTVLETLGGFRGQSSVFKVPVGAGFSGFQVATLQEFNIGEDGHSCPATYSCFGQIVATTAQGGIFSTSNLANLVTTIDAALLPRGVTEKSLRVHHTGSTPFTTACSGDLYTQPSALQVPCRRVVIDKKAGIVTIDAWDDHQGDWGFS